jgi:serine/threonine protein kinase
MPRTLPARVRFGAFELRLDTGELRDGEHGVILQEQLFRILRMLLERDGTLVTREEIRKALWPNDTIVEFDKSINAAIKRLRRILRDSAGQPEYIETVGRRGYRLMVPVEPLETARELPLATESFSQQTGDGAAVRLQPDRGLLGKTVSHYRVLEVIGCGGMGMVYKAEDLKLGRAVALKFLPPEMTSEPIALQRFEREARTASSLSHPNICTVYEVEEYEDQPVLVMELLHGETLRDRLSAIASRKEQMTLDQQLNIALQAIEALQVAHAQGIIHRDIKPANIFLTSSDQVKVLDFGLAKLVTTVQQSGNDNPQLGEEIVAIDAAVAAPSRQSIDATLTRTGSTMGTAGYMSPEQVRGEQLDARTDLFSFGLVLYEMATGQRAFTGETAAIVQNAILHQDLTLTQELNSHLPSTLVAVINKALKKDRDERYQSAAEMRQDLEVVKRELAPTSSGRWKPAAITLASVLLLGATGWLIWSRTINRSRVEFHQPTITRLTNEGDISGPAAISPDGRYLAYQKTEPGKHSLWLRDLVTGASTRITPEEKSRFLKTDFSPDGAFLYYGEGNSGAAVDVYKVSTRGASPVRILTGSLGGIGLSPDGSRIAYKRLGDHGGLQVIVSRDDGTDARILYARDSGNGRIIVAAPSWSPDGKLIAMPDYVVKGEPYMTIAVIDMGGKVTELMPHYTGEVGTNTWLRDGSAIAFIGSLNDESPRILSATYPPGRVAPITNDSNEYDPFSLSITADGKSILAIQQLTSTAFWVCSRDFHNLRQLGARTNVFKLNGTDFDGHRVAFVSSIGGSSSVSITDLEGSPQIQISLPSMSTFDPALSPDGKRVAFTAVSTKNDKANIWLADVDGARLQQLTSGGGDYQPMFAPDGSAIWFTRDDEGPAPHIYKVAISGGQPVRVPNLQLMGVSIVSGDIILARYFDQAASRWRYAIVSPTDGHLDRVFDLPTNTASNPKLVPGSELLSYVDEQDGTSNVWTVSLKGGKPTRVSNFTSDTIYDYAWSHDGKQLLLARGRVYSDAVLISNFR